MNWTYVCVLVGALLLAAIGASIVSLYAGLMKRCRRCGSYRTVLEEEDDAIRCVECGNLWRG